MSALGHNRKCKGRRMKIVLSLVQQIGGTLSIGPGDKGLRTHLLVEF